MGQIQLGFQVESFIIDIVGYEAALRRKLRLLMEIAAKAFLKAAATRVRVRTGFAHGSLGTLSRFLKTSLPAGRPGTRPRKGGETYQTGRGRIRKTTTSGQPFTTQPDQIISVDGDGNIGFNFNIDINYFLKNDVLGHAGYSPWGAYREGFFAFLTFFEAGVGYVFPDLEDFATTYQTNA